MQHLNFYIWELIPIGLAGVEYDGMGVGDLLMMSLLSHQGSFVDVVFLDRIDIIECVAFAVSAVFLEA